MKYHLKVGEKTSEIEVSGTGNPQSLRIMMADKGYDVVFQRVSDQCLHMILNGKATKAFVTQADEGTHVFLAGRCYLVQDADRMALARHRPGRHEEAPSDVTPPMPSVVVRILVNEGDRVKRGQGLVVVTAMKMETTLVAPFDGRVKKLNASVNQKVAPGDILVEIEEEAQDHGG
ncbi:MAG TPA: biotin/lipoyl-containing protein [Desulfatiglandales bacterium]